MSRLTYLQGLKLDQYLKDAGIRKGEFCNIEYFDKAGSPHRTDGPAYIRHTELMTVLSWKVHGFNVNQDQDQPQLLGFDPTGTLKTVRYNVDTDHPNDIIFDDHLLRPAADDPQHLEVYRGVSYIEFGDSTRGRKAIRQGDYHKDIDEFADMDFEEASRESKKLTRFKRNTVTEAINTNNPHFIPKVPMKIDPEEFKKKFDLIEGYDNYHYDYRGKAIWYIRQDEGNGFRDAGYVFLSHIAKGNEVSFYRYKLTGELVYYNESDTPTDDYRPNEWLLDIHPDKIISKNYYTTDEDYSPRSYPDSMSQAAYEKAVDADRAKFGMREAKETNGSPEAPVAFLPKGFETRPNHIYNPDDAAKIYKDSMAQIDTDAKYGERYYNRDDALHRYDGPAIISRNDHVWMINGRNERPDAGPTYISLLEKLVEYRTGDIRSISQRHVHTICEFRNGDIDILFLSNVNNSSVYHMKNESKFSYNGDSELVHFSLIELNGVQGDEHNINGPAVGNYDASVEEWSFMWYVHGEYCGNTRGFVDPPQKWIDKRSGLHEETTPLLEDVQSIMPDFNPSEYDSKYNYGYYNEQGSPHRTDGPAIVEHNRYGEPVFVGFYKNGHPDWKENVPAKVSLITSGLMAIEYAMLGVNHRTDGPAYIHTRPHYPDSIIRAEYHLFGLLHNTNGPAIVFNNADRYALFGQIMNKSDWEAARNSPETKAKESELEITWKKNLARNNLRESVLNEEIELTDEYAEIYNYSNPKAGDVLKLPSYTENHYAPDGYQTFVSTVSNGKGRRYAWRTRTSTPATRWFDNPDRGAKPSKFDLDRNGRLESFSYANNGHRSTLGPSEFRAGSWHSEGDDAGSYTYLGSGGQVLVYCPSNHDEQDEHSQTHRSVLADAMNMYLYDFRDTRVADPADIDELHRLGYISDRLKADMHSRVDNSKPVIKEDVEHNEDQSEYRQFVTSVAPDNGIHAYDIPALIEYEGGYVDTDTHYYDKSDKPIKYVIHDKRYLSVGYYSTRFPRVPRDGVIIRDFDNIGYTIFRDTGTISHLYYYKDDVVVGQQGYAKMFHMDYDPKRKMFESYVEPDTDLDFTRFDMFITGKDKAGYVTYDAEKLVVQFGGEPYSECMFYDKTDHEIGEVDHFEFARTTGLQVRLKRFGENDLELAMNNGSINPDVGGYVYVNGVKFYDDDKKLEDMTALTKSNQISEAADYNPSNYEHEDFWVKRFAKWELRTDDDGNTIYDIEKIKKTFDITSPSITDYYNDDDTTEDGPYLTVRWDEDGIRIIWEEYVDNGEDESRSIFRHRILTQLTSAGKIKSMHVYQYGNWKRIIPWPQTLHSRARLRPNETPWEQQTEDAPQAKEFDYLPKGFEKRPDHIFDPKTVPELHKKYLALVPMDQKYIEYHYNKNGDYHRTDGPTISGPYRVEYSLNGILVKYIQRHSAADADMVDVWDRSSDVSYRLSLKGTSDIHFTPNSRTSPRSVNVSRQGGATYRFGKSHHGADTGHDHPQYVIYDKKILHYATRF